MGQATVDLPDPLEQSAVGMPTTDDLLSQLAGEEIDRLLAEADARPISDDPNDKPNDTPKDIPNNTPSLTPNSKAAAEPHDAPNGITSESHVEIAAPAGPPAPVRSVSLGLVLQPAPVTRPSNNAVPAGGATDPGRSNNSSKASDHPSGNPQGASGAAAAVGVKQAPAPAARPQLLTDLLADLGSDNETDVASGEAEPKGVVIPNDPVEDQTTPSERSALEMPLDLEPDAAPSQEAGVAAPGLLEPWDDDALLPIYLKPLAWLSAPLQALPAPVISLIGKLAILTLLNSFAVLIYVFIFRKHP